MIDRKGYGSKFVRDTFWCSSLPRMFYFLLSDPKFPVQSFFTVLF